MEIQDMSDIAGEKPKGAGKSSFELINPEKLIETLPLKKGSVVLDLACGKGAYSLFFSKYVGDTGLIYAVDLWKEGLLLLDEQIEKNNITNIRPLVADVTEQIEIDDHSVDMCLMATVLHDFEEEGKTDPVLKEVKTLLRPNGCLAVIEFKKIEGPPGPPVHIRLSEDEVEKMVTGYGFQKGKTADIGEYNYFMTFYSNW
jgi:ubiquinone/menaquinone biosynthesis C-methylase UbiE